MDLAYFFYSTVLIIAGSHTQAVTVKLNNQGLTTVPWNQVDGSCTTLNLIQNDITNVIVPTGFHLSVLYLDKNKLTDFPDLTSVKNTLTKLSMGTNMISVIQPPRLLQQLTSLQLLGLNWNPLVKLPALAPLGNLQTLRVKGSLLSTLPNFCLMDPTLRQLKIRTEEVKFSCDKSLIWAKITLANDFVTDLIIMTCASPQHLTGQALADTNVAELITKDSLHYHSLTDSEKFYCDFPKITSVQANVSKVSCGLQCTNQPGCVLYAHDGGKCVLTQYIDGSPGTKQAFDVYTNWMMLN